MKIFRLAMRSLMHFKLYSAVNVLGLALSLACVIVIARYVHNETTVDRFNSRLDRIYVTTYERTEASGDIEFAAVDNGKREDTFVDLRNDPAVERWANFRVSQDQTLQEGENKFEIGVAYADTSFLQILDYPIVTGSGDLSKPDNILITATLAHKLFGKSDPLGKQLLLEGKTVTVGGIIGTVRTKSTLTFDAIAPLRNWSQTLVMLHSRQDYRAVNKKYSEFFETNNRRGGVSVDGVMLGAPPYVRYQLFPLQKVYFDTTILDHSDTYQHGKRSSVLVLSLVGLLVGLVGIFNFINIYTAVVLRRGREFGMKKVFGAPAGKVFLQLLAENILMIALALIIALALTEVFNPVVRNLLGFEQMPFRRFDALLALGLLVGIPLITTTFPFLHYNYTAPIRSLQSVGKTGGRSATRGVFLVFQYVLTIGMVIVSLLFLKQLHHMLHSDLGFSTAGIIQVPMRELEQVRRSTKETYDQAMSRYKTILDRIAASPLFIGHATGFSPTTATHTTEFRLDGGDNELKPVLTMGGNEKWFEFFDFELTHGRFVNKEQDGFGTYRLMVTESALPYFGITDVDTEKIQPKQRLWSSSARPEEMNTNPGYEIVGVVRDFYPSYLGGKTVPIVMMYEGMDHYTLPIMAKIAPGKRQEAIEFMRALHEEFVGGEFTYSFIEDDLRALYAEDRKVATVYGIFTVIAIAISVLGLFSLSLFDVQRRRREIAIRKVNGATTGDVLGLLLKRYLYLLVIAFVIAVPLAWLAIHRYLEGFAYKTAVSWWIFAAALLLTAGVSLLTLIWQVRKAAAADPARVIRSE
jgi:ABC-type antimicrobial peptide transport system permease subunit